MDVFGKGQMHPSFKTQTLPEPLPVNAPLIADIVNAVLYLIILKISDAANHVVLIFCD